MFVRRSVRYFFLFAVIFTAFSLPFLFGMLRPTFADKNPYALFYTFCNLPATFLFGGIRSWMAELLWDNPSVRQLDLASFYVSLLFWSLLGAIIGAASDLREGSNR